jgi:hypothetical protein
MTTHLPYVADQFANSTHDHRIIHPAAHSPKYTIATMAFASAILLE